MAQQWYLDVGSKVEGPFPAKHLRAMAQAGRLAPEARVSLDRNKWFRAEQVKGLFVAPSSETSVPGASPHSKSAANETAADAAALNSFATSGPPASPAPLHPAPAERPSPPGLIDGATRESPAYSALLLSEAQAASAGASPVISGPTFPSQVDSFAVTAFNSMPPDPLHPSAAGGSTISPGTRETQPFQADDSKESDALTKTPAPPGEDPINAQIRRTLGRPLDAIPGYEILHVLGRGGMGVVYAARHLKLDRVVAVKTLLVSRLEAGTMLARFEQEARTIARLRHLNIVTAYDFGQHDGQLYLVMELLEGESLEAVLDRGERLDERTAWAIARQAASGLAHATQHGIVHRDVKPGNLMLVAPPDGLAMPTGVDLVKVTDFGIALLETQVGESMRLTGAATAMGTPLYMAPEQASGEAVDARADVYALGATLYHLLSGRPPFDGRTPIQLVLAKLNHTAEPLRPTIGVCEATDRLLAEMLTADKAERIADYETLIARIDALPCFADGPAAPGATGPAAVPRSTVNSLAAPLAASTLAATAPDLPSVAPPPSIAPHDFVAPHDSDAPSAGSRRPPLWLIAVGGAAALVVAAALWVFVPKPLPSVPRMMTTGYEQPLYDGQGLGGWLPMQGLWTPTVDEEGGMVLSGVGVARRALPPLPNYAVTVHVQLAAAKVVEVEFGVHNPSEIDTARYGVRLENGQATLVSHATGGATTVLSPKPLTLPSAGNGDARGPYFAVRIEKQGPVWWAFCEDQAIGAAHVLPEESSEVRLHVTGGAALFEELSAAELTFSK